MLSVDDCLLLSSVCPVGVDCIDATQVVRFSLKICFARNEHNDNYQSNLEGLWNIFDSVLL